MTDKGDELERARSMRWFYRKRIQELGDVSRPVTPVDRAQIAEALLRLYDRTSWLEDRIRELQGEPAIGMGPPTGPK